MPRWAHVVGGQSVGAAYFDYPAVEAARGQMSAMVMRRHPAHDESITLGWEWVAEGDKGVENTYFDAVRRVQARLKAANVNVAELEEDGNTPVGKAIKAASAVVVVLMMLAALALVLLLFVGCNVGEETKPAPQMYQWKQYPLQVKISADLDACRMASVYAALRWYEVRAGVSNLWIPQVVPEAALSVTGIPEVNTVEISAEPPYEPDQLGATQMTDLKGFPGYAYSAQVRTRSCDVWVWAHELGHALLGLGHATGEKQLMRRVGANGWDLLPVEVQSLTSR